MKTNKTSSVFSVIIALISILTIGCSSEGPLGQSDDISQTNFSLDFGTEVKLIQVAGKIEKVDLNERTLGLVENKIIILIDKNTHVRYNNRIESRGNDLSSIKTGDEVIAYGSFISKNQFEATELDVRTFSRIGTLDR